MKNKLYVTHTKKHKIM